MLMADSKEIAEVAARYDARVADLHGPLVVEHDGRPVAVLISFPEYQRLCALASDEEQRKQAAWIELNKLLASVHGRASDDTPVQIEAEITAAHKEVKKTRRAHRSGH
jgi:PHD/YefM family antitoxin component YafN of YafNO toxin-antitoxin module